MSKPRSNKRLPKFSGNAHKTDMGLIKWGPNQQGTGSTHLLDEMRAVVVTISILPGGAAEHSERLAGQQLS